jgi:sterol desaturase/sphingolipid hydroxylase (fatty acid hydroxylase superfamily)
VRVDGEAQPVGLAVADIVKTARTGAATQYALLAFTIYFVLLAVGWWGFDRLMPDRIVLTIWDHEFLIDKLHRRALAIGFLPAYVVPAVFAWEIAKVGWGRSSLRHLLAWQSDSSRSDLIIFLMGQVHLGNLVRVALTFGAALITGTWLHAQICQATGVSLSLHGLPWPLQYAVYFMIFSFFDYWCHRLDHSRWFWPLHRYHHSAEEFYVLTSSRVHPASFSDIVSITLPLAMIQVPPGVIVLVGFFVGSLRFVIHSRLETDFGWIGRYVLQSPAHHRLHHIRDTSQPTGHYSLMPLWDHLFGTWRGKADQWIVIGVTEVYRHGAWVAPDLWRDYIEFLAGLVRIRRNQPLGIRKPA